MSNIKLCHLSAGQAIALKGSASDQERPFQTLMEDQGYERQQLHGVSINVHLREKYARIGTISHR